MKSLKYIMPALYVGLIAVAAVALLAVPAMASHEVKVAEDSAYQKFLTDSEGMTLYWFAKDTPGTSVCMGGCEANWPVYYRESVAPIGGIMASDFGTITRSDGKMQTTYKGWPLYYFAGDTMAGDTSGDGKGSVWYTINPDSFPVK